MVGFDDVTGSIWKAQKFWCNAAPREVQRCACACMSKLALDRKYNVVDRAIVLFHGVDFPIICVKLHATCVSLQSYHICRFTAELSHSQGNALILETSLRRTHHHENKSCEISGRWDLAVVNLKCIWTVPHPLASPSQRCTMAGRVSQLAKAAVNKMIKLTVNGSTVQVPQGSTLLAAIQKSRVHIPTLCYHPEFKSRAVCRLCLVEIAGYSKPVPACYTPAEEGLIVTTHSPDLKAYRQRDLEFLLSRHPNECIRCEAAGDCKLQDLVQEEQVADVWPKSTRGSPKHPEHRLHDHTSPSIFRDIDKCINCGLCVDACAAQRIDAIGFAERGAGRVNVTAFDTPLAETGCISCGQCTLRCPVGALIERPDWHRVLEVLDSKKRKTVVQTAPATRIAIGEEFDLEPGTVSTGRLVHALRALGFDYVTDTNFSADLTIMEEANELVARVKGEREGKLPLFTSCCPGMSVGDVLCSKDILLLILFERCPMPLLTSRCPVFILVR